MTFCVYPPTFDSCNHHFVISMTRARANLFQKCGLHEDQMCMNGNLFINQTEWSDYMILWVLFQKKKEWRHFTVHYMQSTKDPMKSLLVSSFSDMPPEHHCCDKQIQTHHLKDVLYWGLQAAWLLGLRKVELEQAQMCWISRWSLQTTQCNCQAMCCLVWHTVNYNSQSFVTI